MASAEPQTATQITGSHSQVCAVASHSSATELYSEKVVGSPPRLPRSMRGEKGSVPGPVESLHGEVAMGREAGITVVLVPPRGAAWPHLLPLALLSAQLVQEA